LDDIAIDDLYRVPRVRYYFRYRLHRKDFHDLQVDRRIRGHYAAKPLYGRLTSRGLVDRSGGYNGDIAALFVPIEAEDAEEAQVLLTHIPPERVVTSAGSKNWKAIRAAAEQRIRESL
jgi:hypothetical protein